MENEKTKENFFDENDEKFEKSLSSNEEDNENFENDESQFEDESEINDKEEFSELESKNVSEKENKKALKNTSNESKFYVNLTKPYKSLSLKVKASQGFLSENINSSLKNIYGFNPDEAVKITNESSDEEKKKFKKSKIKVKDRFSFTRLTLFDIWFDAFVVGFLVEFLSLIFENLFFANKKHKLSIKKVAINSLKKGIYMLIFAFPFSLINILMIAFQQSSIITIGATAVLSAEIINIYQAVLFIIPLLVALAIFMAQEFLKTENKQKTNKSLLIFVIQTIVIFAIMFMGEIIELQFENVIVATLISTLYLTIVSVLIRLGFCFWQKLKLKKEKSNK